MLGSNVGQSNCPALGNITSMRQDFEEQGLEERLEERSAVSVRE